MQREKHCKTGRTGPLKYSSLEQSPAVQKMTWIRQTRLTKRAYGTRNTTGKEKAVEECQGTRQEREEAPLEVIPPVPDSHTDVWWIRNTVPIQVHSQLWLDLGVSKIFILSC